MPVSYVPNMTFVSTLKPSFCFDWLTFTTGVTTYNTLNQDIVSGWDMSSQSSTIPSVDVQCCFISFYLFFYFCLFVCFSVNHEAQQSSNGLLKKITETVLLWNFKVCMLKQTLTVFFDGI